MLLCRGGAALAEELDQALDNRARARGNGRVARGRAGDGDGARRGLAAFAEAGIDYDDGVATLEREGVEKFAKSFQQLFADVEAKKDSRVAAASCARPAAAASWGSSCAWTRCGPARRQAPATPPRPCPPRT